MTRLAYSGLIAWRRRFQFVTVPAPTSSSFAIERVRRLPPAVPGAALCLPKPWGSWAARFLARRDPSLPSASSQTTIPQRGTKRKVLWALRCSLARLSKLVCHQSRCRAASVGEVRDVALTSGGRRPVDPDRGRRVNLRPSYLRPGYELGVSIQSAPLRPTAITEGGRQRLVGDEAEPRHGQGRRPRVLLALGQRTALTMVGSVISPVYERETQFGSFAVDVSFTAHVNPVLMRDEISHVPELSSAAIFRGGREQIPSEDDQAAALDILITGAYRRYCRMSVHRSGVKRYKYSASNPA